MPEVTFKLVTPRYLDHDARMLVIRFGTEELSRIYIPARAVDAVEKAISHNTPQLAPGIVVETDGVQASVYSNSSSVSRSQLVDAVKNLLYAVSDEEEQCPDNHQTSNKKP